MLDRIQVVHQNLIERLDNANLPTINSNNKLEDTSLHNCNLIGRF